ncbi:MAG: hypothetical protein KIH89_002290 [Candidatus Shapirobacteria bacterium]|nr:hypothetical protein [Candidatus Shapirobacteria bacterium]
MGKESYNENYRISFRGDYPGVTVSSRYTDILTALVRRGSIDFKEYKGGPLNLHNPNESWVSPMEVIDSWGQQNFHLLRIGGTPETQKTTEADVLLFDEMQVKLGSNPDLENLLNSFFRSVTPKNLIRPVQVGINVFPRMYTPEEFDNNRLPVRIQKLAAETGLTINHTYDFREPSYAPSLEFSQESGMCALNEREYLTEKGKKVFVTDFILNNDPWKFYQVLSGERLSDFLSNHDPSTPIPLRIDSGCDSGQLYHDRGCECRDQLHKAIDESIQEGGLIIHIPTQDGRGYGMVTKMETEGIKRGHVMTYNHDNPVPVDTIKAAKLVFGESEEFDIRTFDGVGRILKTLGVHKICLMTDNKTKIRHMKEAGVEVCRILDAQVVVTDPELANHIKSKHEDHAHYNGGIQ